MATGIKIERGQETEFLDTMTSIPIGEDDELRTLPKMHRGMSVIPNKAAFFRTIGQILNETACPTRTFGVVWCVVCIIIIIIVIIIIINIIEQQPFQYPQ